jgi:hypothetical protein
MAHMEYPSPYSPFDFASFLNSTISNFFNALHCNGGTKICTLVCWIPIFHPLNSPEDSPILANDGFDMVGFHFTFKDSQVYLDLNHEVQRCNQYNTQFVSQEFVSAKIAKNHIYW